MTSDPARARACSGCHGHAAHPLPHSPAWKSRRGGGCGRALHSIKHGMWISNKGFDLASVGSYLLLRLSMTWALQSG